MTTILRKYLVSERNISTLEYLCITFFTKIMILSLLILVMYLIKRPELKTLNPKNLTTKFIKNYDIFIAMKFIGIISFFIYMHILKTHDLSYSAPLSSVSGVLITTGLSIILLNEKITPLRIIGLTIGCLSICMLK